MQGKLIICSIFSVFTILSCNTSQVQQQIDKDKRIGNGAFQVVNAEIKEWEAGYEGSKGYSLKIDVKGSMINEIIVDSIWFYKNKALKPSVYIKEDVMVLKGSYSESSKVSFTDVKTGEKKRAERSFHAPISYSGNALIRAYLKGEEKYFIIDSLKRVR